MWIWLQIFQCFRTHLVYCIHFRSDWPNFPNWIGEWMLKNAILTLGKINAFHILCCEFEMALPPKRIQNMDSTWLTFQAFCSYIPRYVYYSAYKRVVQYSTTLVCFEKKMILATMHRTYFIGGSSFFNFIRYECVMCGQKVAVFLLFIFLSLGGAAFTVFLKVFFKINFIGNDLE